MRTQPNDGKRHAQRHAFALASQLRQRFRQRGISIDDFWHAVKVDHGVDSRSEIAEIGYVKLAARLDAAKRHPVIFNEMCRGIRERRVNAHATIKTLSEKTHPKKV